MFSRNIASLTGCWFMGEIHHFYQYLVPTGHTFRSHSNCKRYFDAITKGILSGSFYFVTTGHGSYCVPGCHLFSGETLTPQNTVAKYFGKKKRQSGDRLHQDHTGLFPPWELK